MKHLSLIAVLIAGCAGGSDSSAGSTPALVVAPAAIEAPAVADEAPTPEGTDSGQLAGYDGVFANDAQLTVAQVAMWPSDQLALKRNEIYARYGRAFQSAELRAHFEAMPWYRVVDSYSDARLTDADKANAALIKSFEGQTPARDGQVGKLWFVDASTLVISDDPSMYGFVGQERRYVARGADHLVTWSGADRFDPGSPAVKDAEVWTWSGGDWSRTPIPRPKG